MTAAISRKRVARTGTGALCALLAAALILALAASPASAAVPSICKPGAGAGKCDDTEAVAVDQSTGEVYVADAGTFRIEVFDSSGHFLRAFGFGVGGGNKLETCTTLCIAGSSSGGPGAMSPHTIAVDPATHDVYAFDRFRVEKYTAAGEFLWMAGGGVDQGPHHPGNLCTAAYIAEGDSCGTGSRGGGPGQFSEFPAVDNGNLARSDNQDHGLAVDSSGDLWVGDENRVEEFSAAGVFLAELALPGEGEVASLAADSSGDLYAGAAGVNELQSITPPAGGTYTLSFEGQTTKPLAFDASDGEIEAALEALSTIGNSIAFFGVSKIRFGGKLGETNVPQLEISSGSDSTPREGAPSTLRKFSPTGELLASFDTSGHPSSFALDPATGNLFVSDLKGLQSGKATLLEFNPAGEQIAAFGSGEVIGAPQGGALAFGDSAQRLYVASSAGQKNSAVQPFPLPAPGPLPLAGTAKANPIAKLSASPCSRVNPEHAETKARFQYISAAKYEEDGNSFGAGTLETVESGSLGSDFSFEHELCQPISSLVPGTGYRFRMVAHNANGTVKGETASFESLPPAAIDSTGVSSVAAESATLETEVNPLGDETSYRFQYLTEARYEANLEESLPPFTGAAQAPLQPAQIGKGSTDVSLSQHLQGLAPSTAYRYRVLVRNKVSEEHPSAGQENGDFAGPASTFTTQSPTAGAGLPDNRAWEQVSPPNKYGAKLKLAARGLLIQAAANGDALAYLASAPTEAEPGGYSANGGTTVLGGRGPSGWSSRDLTPPHGHEVGVILGIGDELHAFSSDLSQSIVQPFGPFEAQISPAASEQTPFLRTDFAPASPSAICANGEGCYRPLVTGCPASGECPAPVHALADVPAGTEFGLSDGEFAGPAFLSATPDLSHVVIETKASVSLLPGAPADSHVLYEWSATAPPAEALRVLSVLPSGEAVGNAKLGLASAVLRNAISADGSRVVFEAEEKGKSHLYLRTNATEPQSALNGAGECTEPEKACTIQLDAIRGGLGASQVPKALFQDASADGSRILFTDTQQLTADSGGGSNGGGDLYECRIVTGGSGEPECALTDLTPETEGEAAGVQGLVPGASTDGSAVYFVADGVLTGAEENARGESAQPGSCVRGHAAQDVSAANTCNLYLRRDGVTTFIATLSEADRPDWNGQNIFTLSELTSRVSPDGRLFAFMSQRPLTGYDNRDAVSGERDEEVFLYRAPAGEGEEGTLLCASCDPSGARPHGTQFEALKQAREGEWAPNSWLAASLPAWSGYDLEQALYQPRYLSDSGRLFFNSSDALLPADTNGQEDVYEYEPPKGGGAEPPNDTCTTASSTFSSTSGGCVSLISSGTSPEESVFLDASETGSDVFFLTTSKLLPTDTDSSYDAYDARSPHVPGEVVGYHEAPKPVECVGDGCQAPPAPPANATPGSLAYSGPGNLSEEAAPAKKKKKSKKHSKKAKKRRHAKRGGSSR